MPIKKRQPYEAGKFPSLAELALKKTLETSSPNQQSLHNEMADKFLALAIEKKLITAETDLNVLEKATELDLQQAEFPIPIDLLDHLLTNIPSLQVVRLPNIEKIFSFKDTTPNFWYKTLINFQQQLGREGLVMKHRQKTWPSALNFLVNYKL